mgnify:CR=1 FL=1
MHTQLDKISPRYCQGHMEMVLWNDFVALSGRIKLLLSFFSPLIHVSALSPAFKDKHSHWLAFHDIGCFKYSKACGVCLHNCRENMVWIVWRRFHFCTIKSNKCFIFWFCSRMQLCSIMSDDILILIDEHTCAAWFVIALVRIVYLFIYLFSFA